MNVQFSATCNYLNCIFQLIYWNQTELCILKYKEIYDNLDKAKSNNTLALRVIMRVSCKEYIDIPTAK